MNFNLKSSLRPLGAETIHHGRFIGAFCAFTHAKTIVEIGVQYGHTTAWLCDAAMVTGGTVYGYDFFPSNGEGIGGDKRDFPMQGAIDHISQFGLTNYVLRKVDSHSEEFDELLRQDLQNAPSSTIDVAFIDGDHSYAGAKQDFEKIFPLLSEDGTIILHDTYICRGLRKLVIELYENNDGTYDILNLPFGRGNERLGLSFITKRSFPLYDRGILFGPGKNSCPHDPDMTSEEVYRVEQEWYKKQLKKRE